jgi:hypothetical protein
LPFEPPPVIVEGGLNHVLTVRSGVVASVAIATAVIGNARDYMGVLRQIYTTEDFVGIFDLIDGVFADWQARQDTRFPTPPLFDINYKPKFGFIWTSYAKTYCEFLALSQRKSRASGKWFPSAGRGQVFDRDNRRYPVR